MTSVYNSSITTRLIDPIFEKSKFRSEYRLNPETLYLPNLRLLHAGIDSDTSTQLNGLVGTYGCIKSIQLYDGNQLLDQVLEASIINGFRNFNTSNDMNCSVNRFIKGHNLGYVCTGKDEINTTDGSLLKDKVKVKTQSSHNNDANQAWIALNQILPFLQSSVTLPTNVFTHLRIVVNWKSESELRDMVGKNAGARAFNLSTYTNTVLVADEMNASDSKNNLMNGYVGVAYRPIEHDSVEIRSVAPPTDETREQESNVMVKGFNGKQVNTLLMVNTPTNRNTWADSGTNTNSEFYTNQGSVSQYKPQIQVRINGSNKLARNGLTGYNKRLATLVDAYGEVNIVMNQNVPNLKETGNYVDVDEVPTGQLDYTGMRVDEYVNEMIIDYTRTGVSGNENLNQAVRLNLFAEVNKQVVMRNDGRYNVVYSQM